MDFTYLIVYVNLATFCNLLQGNWPESFKREAKGECACEHGYDFDQSEAECQNDFFYDAGKVALGVIIAIIVGVIVMIGCCIAVAFCIFKAAR